MSLSRMLLSVLALVYLFTSCKKENFPETGDKLLQRVVSDKDSLLSTTFYYDAQNRLTEKVDSNRQGHVRETSIKYDVAGNPVKFTALHYYQSNAIESKTEDSLVYANDRVVKKLHNSPSSTAFKLINTYGYDANGRLIIDTAYSYWTNEIVGYTHFTYDVNDDIVQCQEINNSSGVMDSVSSTTVTYNSVKNPYKNLGLTLYFVTGDYSLLGMHNKTKVVNNQRNFERYTREYAYEYDSDGLPNKMILSRSYGGQLYGVSTYDFYY